MHDSPLLATENTVCTRRGSYALLFSWLRLVQSVSLLQAWGCHVHPCEARLSGSKFCELSHTLMLAAAGCSFKTDTKQCQISAAWRPQGFGWFLAHCQDADDALVVCITHLRNLMR